MNFGKMIHAQHYHLTRICCKSVNSSSNLEVEEEEDEKERKKEKQKKNTIFHAKIHEMNEHAELKLEMSSTPEKKNVNTNLFLL